MKKFDFQIQAGDDLKVKVSIVDKQSQPVDVSSYRAAMQIRSCIDSPEAIDTLTTENGRILMDNGFLVLDFVNQATETYKAGSLVYDLELISPTNFITKILGGTIRVFAEVTKIEQP